MKLYQKLQHFFQEKKQTKQKSHNKQQIEQPLVSKLYQTYPEQPYIHPNRDLEAWEAAAQADATLLVPQENMVRDDLGLLPGDIYLLYFLFRHRNEQFPYYFEYFFGIDVEQELTFLTSQGLINEQYRPTKEGCLQIDDYAFYLEKMKQYLQQLYPNLIY